MSKQITYVFFEKKLKEFEGDYEYLYICSAGKVTVGVGLMYPSAQKLLGSQYDFRKIEYVGKGDKSNKHIKNALRLGKVSNEYKSDKKASKDEIVAEFNNVHGKKTPTLYVKDKSKLDDEFNTRVIRAYLDAMGWYDSSTDSTETDKYKTFLELPMNVRYALWDMSFNMGVYTKDGKDRGLKAYHGMKAALKKGDFIKAAGHSNRKGIQPSRNKFAFNLISGEAVANGG